MKFNQAIVLITMSIAFNVNRLEAQVVDSFPDTLAVAIDTIPIQIRPDDPILASLDALWAEERLKWQCFENDTLCLNSFGFDVNQIPVYPDSVLAARIAKLNNETPLNLQYNNHVKGFINLYTQRRRDVTSRVLGLAALYYPLFEEKLDMFDMPLELKHLAVVESALYAPAKSKAGAAGLWQFMFTTGRMYDLEVDSYFDDRMDPIKSTIAACRYMSYLYKLYGDWNLVLAAYNSGPGNVNKAIRRSGGKKDYWEIWNHLPAETRGYVPAFIAVNYVMNYASEHNIYPTKPAYLFGEIDTVHVCGPTRLDQIAYFAGISNDEIALLNPSIRKGEIPKSDKCKAVYLPVNSIGTFLSNRDSLQRYMPSPVIELARDVPPAKTISTMHVVKRGESLGLIASRNKVSISDLKQWNNLKSDNIQPGQKLNIQKPVTASVSTTKKETVSGTKVDVSSAQKVHIVQSGDTLWDIAQRYPGISVNDIKQANSDLNLNKLKPGQKLKIPLS
jgi:membrane-bound lytic murein transglycosylase D